MVLRFVQPEWGTVRRAKWELESRQKEAIPELIALLDRQEVVKLANTLDLIYPGAETFYGHGYIMPYDLDYIPARAGWALEELTFENFGFKGSAIREDALFEATRRGQMDVPLSKVVPPDLTSREQRSGTATAQVEAWWRANAAGWTRLKALRNALTSEDADRQLRALSWLRWGTTRCDGLSPEVYARDLKPLAEKLAGSPNPGVKEQAQLLLRENNSWWSYKTDPELRDW
ncbi:MAG TPA: hypothetical protein VIC28_16815 [Thermoanaerobaculia bacterium]